MNKARAFLVHLACSTLVVGALLVFVAFHIYGKDLFFATDSYKLLAIIAAIDLVVGPLLTAIVYRRGKPRLALDLGVIVALQLGFLAYGGWVCWQSRPVALILRPDVLEVVFANESDPLLLQAVESLGIDTGFGGPKLVSKFEQDKPEDNIVDLLNLMTYGGSPERVSAYAAPSEIAPTLAREVGAGRLQTVENGPEEAARLPLLSLRGQGFGLVRTSDARLMSIERTPHK